MQKSKTTPKNFQSKFKHSATYDRTIKLLVVGDCGVGKTSLITKYVDGQFSQNYVSTIGIDFKQKIVKIAGKTIKLQIWDTAGQERFHTITQAYYRGAHGLIITFALNNLASFKNIQYWLKHIDEGAAGHCPKILIGTKSDILNQKIIKREQISELVESTKFSYFEVSSKTGKNVQESISKLIEQILKTSDQRCDLKTNRETLTSQRISEVANRHKCSC